MTAEGVGARIGDRVAVGVGRALVDRRSLHGVESVTVGSTLSTVTDVRVGVAPVVAVGDGRRALERSSSRAVGEGALEAAGAGGRLKVATGERAAPQSVRDGDERVRHPDR